MKLKIELVPSTSAGRNLSSGSIRSGYEWADLAKNTIDNAGNKCQICGATGVFSSRLECHEIWSYDEIKHVQKLIGLIALCKLCHWVKHIRGIEYDKSNGKLDRAIDHFKKINECDENKYYQHRYEAEIEYVRLSNQFWHIDVEEYIRSQGFLKTYLFNWFEIPGNDAQRLIDYLKQRFGNDWIKTAKIEKSQNKIYIKVSNNKNFIKVQLNNAMTKLNIEIDDGRTDELSAKIELNKLKIYL